MRHSRVGFLAQALVAAILVACASDDPSGRTSGDGGQSQGGLGAGSGGQGGGDGDGDGFDNAPPQAVDSGAPVPPDSGLNFDDCASDTQSAAQVDVDMYIMLDRSDSMRGLTGAGQSKWDAIRSALTSFVDDPQSEGLGVGLQYFPLGAQGVPERCTSDDDCGAQGGPCRNRACLPGSATAEFTECLVDSQCPDDSPGCVPFGICQLDDTLACFDLAGGCEGFGACEPVESSCLYYASCVAEDYFTPDVTIGTLPDHAIDLVDSLTTAEPVGLTPTPPAIVGAIDRARAHAADNPTHRVMAVLATDGLPTDCWPDGTESIEEAVDLVAELAALGVDLDPSVLTYVIGVFSPEDPGAMENLDRIARGGGTDSAFIVDPAADVAQQFLDALSEIRGGSLACEFQLPEPPDGEELDFMLVNVELMDEGGDRQLVYVGGPDGCDRAELGWYYDSDPSDPAQPDPTKISVCDATCDVLQGAREATVQIRLGCPTQGPE